MDCGHLNGTMYTIAGIVHSCSATISFFASLIVIFMIILFKKVQFFTHRLILYLSLAAMLYSVATASSKTDYYTLNRQLCKWIAFATQYSQWCLLMAVCVMTGDVLVRMARAEKVEHPNRTSSYLELFYIVLIFVVPASFNWLPLLWNLYGISGDWCWVKDTVLNGRHCELHYKRGLALQFGLWYGPLFLVCCLIIISYVIIYLLLKYQRRHMNTYDPGRIQLIREIRKEIYCIVWYPVVFMVINIFPLADRIYMIFNEEPLYVLLLLHALISPLQGGLVCLMYGIHPNTRISLNLQNFREAFILCCHKDEHEVHEYKAIPSREKGDLSEKTGLLENVNKTQQKTIH